MLTRMIEMSLSTLDVFEQPAKEEQESSEKELVDVARSGDQQAYDELVLGMERYIAALANRLFRRYQWSSLIEVEDLVQHGYQLALEYRERALAHDNPLAYLRTAVKGELLNYCKQHCSVIRVPITQGVTAYWTMSLNAPLRSNGEKQERTLLEYLSSEVSPPQSSSSASDYTALYQAVEALSPKQRTVIIRHYGLYDASAETLGDLVKDLYGSGKSLSSVANHKYAALQTLREYLLSSYPQYRSVGLPVQCATLSQEKTPLSPDQERRLDQAYAHLLQAGQDISYRKLAKSAGIGQATARVYMRERGISGRKDRDIQGRLDRAYAALMLRGVLITVKELREEASVATYTALRYLRGKQQRGEERVREERG